MTLGSSNFFLVSQWSSLSRAGMPSYCCSSSDFLQSHYTVLLSSFLLPFSCTSGCCCSLPCISQADTMQILLLHVIVVLVDVIKTGKSYRKERHIAWLSYQGSPVSYTVTRKHNSTALPHSNYAHLTRSISPTQH